MNLINLYSSILFLIVLGYPSYSNGKGYAPGKQFEYKTKDLPKGVYQYSIWVPKNYDPKKEYPVVFYLHGGGGRKFPSYGKKNIISDRLIDNQNWTSAGYSGNAHGLHEYIHVAPVKAIYEWEAKKFKALLKHVNKKVNINENRVYVTGFSMGGQGTWIVGCGSSLGYKIAAMMPLGAWGCEWVNHGTTPETCMTRKTPVWVLHCPYDEISKISDQIDLFRNHLNCGGYGRFTMIPGEGHIQRPRGDDDEGLSMRVAWMLSQTYDTPHNYLVQTKGGVILEAIEGERPFIGDTSTYGFFEPNTKINITAAATKNGQRFLKWASLKGKFEDPKSRRTSYTTVDNDSELFAIYENQKVKLSVFGGKADPKKPMPGDKVTITINKNQKDKPFLFWQSNPTIELTQPYENTVQFCMPPHDLVISAKPKKY